MTNTQHPPSDEDATRPPAACDNTGVMVTMTDNTLGAIFLGILALSLLVALLRAQARIRELQAQTRA